MEECFAILKAECHKGINLLHDTAPSQAGYRKVFALDNWRQKLGTAAGLIEG